MFQVPGAGALWRSLTGGGSGTQLPRTYPTMSGTFPQPGVVPSYPQPDRPRMAVDEVLQQVWPQPWYGANDLDPLQGESPENRALYLALYKKEPRLNAAIEGKIASIATMKFRWKGADENSMADVEAAQFMDEMIKQSRHGGTIGLIASIMRPGQVYGWSAGEIKLCVQERGRFRGKWGLEHVRNLNTEPFIKLQLDVYRNITGVVNLIRGIQDYDPKKFVFYVNKPIFSNPFGQSDVQPAQRAAMLFREVYQIWYIALKRYGLPYMHGQVANPNYRKALEEAMEDLQGSGWAVTGPEDKITVLDLAAAAAAHGFEAMIDKNSEDIFFAVRGASTPSQVSSNKGSDVRGSSEDSKQTGQDPIEKLAAEEVCKSINQNLVPALMGPNFPPSVGMPYLSIGDADEDDAKTRLDIIDIVENKLGRPCSTEEIYEIANVNPGDPSNPDDAKRIQSLQQQQMKPQLPGAVPGQPKSPGGDGSPPQIGGGSPATPKPPQPGNAPTQMSQPVTTPDVVGSTEGTQGQPVPAELIVAMLQAQMEGHPAATDAIAEMGQDPEALKEFLADHAAGMQGMMSNRMFSAFARRFSSSSPIAAGLAVRAKDTGRVLVLKRKDSDNDPASGKWEFPGGHLKGGESPRAAAFREWSEETGHVFDVDRGVQGVKESWESPNGKYAGFFTEVDNESKIVEEGTRDQEELLAWISPDKLADLDIRDELRKSLPQILPILRGDGAISEVRYFGWFADPSPRSPSRVTNSDTGQHKYGEAARRALAWQGREDKGEAHPQTTKDLLIAKKAEAEPQREAARQAYTQAISNPGSVHSGQLKQLADHLHTLTRDEVRSHLAQVQRKSAGKLKHDLVDALLSHVRDTAIEHHESKMDPLGMGMDQDIAAKAIQDLQGTSLPRKQARDQEKEAEHAKANSHATRQEERHKIIKAGTMGDLQAPGKVSHGTPDTGSVLKEGIGSKFSAASKKPKKK